MEASEAGVAELWNRGDRLAGRGLDRAGPRAGTGGAVLFQLARPGRLRGVDLCSPARGGVCMGYHRCLTHGSFKTYRPVRWLLAFLGGLSGEGSALTWVANHRKHHHFSDKHGDPHSPRDGSWWSHMLWFMPNFGRRWHKELVEKYAPDILEGQDDGGDSLPVPAVALRDGRRAVSRRLLRHGDRPGRLVVRVVAWCSGASACGWCTCCT